MANYLQLKRGSPLIVNIENVRHVVIDDHGETCVAMPDGVFVVDDSIDDIRTALVRGGAVVDIVSGPPA